VTADPNIARELKTAQMTLSVALCTFNGERYIAQQLQSIFAQTELPLEIVICDDGSTDRTLWIIENMPASPVEVRIYRNSKNLHFAANFFKAASLCRGEYILFCDQDDIWEPNKVARIRNLLGREQPDLIIHQARRLDDKNGFIDPVTVPPMRRDLSEPDLHAVIGSYALGCCYAVRSRLIAQFPKFWEWDRFSQLKKDHGPFVGHDMIIFAHCWGKGTVRVLNEPLMQYRIHEGNVFGRMESAESYSLRHRLANKLSSKQLMHQGKSLIAQAELLRQIAAESDLGYSNGLAQLEAQMKKRGTAMLNRAPIYDRFSKRIHRIEAWYRTLISGSYALGPEYFGISRLAALKDLLAAVR
jgi:glycosyltransferase involved in cell wall biosynthesis